MSTAQIPNPRYVGAPARMSDGRLFTEYRRSGCRLLPPVPQGHTWGDWERHQMMTQTGIGRMSQDRMIAHARAGATNCVDTMVPELTKRVASWQGTQNFLAHPVGLGAGRMYLPGRPDLIGADPDVVAAETLPMLMLPGTYEGAAYGATHATKPGLVGPARPNRYSLPYGNQ
jgi:hypothetical protein